MGNVFIHVTMSLDGLIARPNDAIDWAFHYGTDHMVQEVMAEIGAVVLGNRKLRDRGDQLTLAHVLGPPLNRVASKSWLDLRHPLGQFSNSAMVVALPPFLVDADRGHRRTGSRHDRNL